MENPQEAWREQNRAQRAHAHKERIKNLGGDPAWLDQQAEKGKQDKQNPKPPDTEQIH